MTNGRCVALRCLLACATIVTIAAPGLAVADAPLPADASPTGLPADVSAASDATKSDDELLPFKLSLPTESDREGWRTAGYRMQLGYAYGRLWGFDGAPNGHTHTAIVRAGMRLDELWSLIASFQFAAANSGVTGLRFAGTLDPTWHLNDSFELAIGLGFGGIVESRTGRPDPNAEQRTTLVQSYTFPSASPSVTACSGVGAAALVRGAYNVVLGPMSAGALALELDGQWTGCVERLGRLEPDTARPIERRQWWPHLAATLGWTFGWR